MPTAIVDDATSFPAVTTPGGAEVPNAASLQASVQQLANRTAYLQALGLAGKIFEGFEVAVPPTTPAGCWSAPSVRFGGDGAYARDLVNPITGVASANRPGAQLANTNSSLGLSNVYLDSPARIAFVFDLLCNASFGDHLDFYIDGVLTAKYSTTTNATVSAGRFVSDVLREGIHTFDWRFVRGGAASVANEKARVDAVNIIPENAWTDQATRIDFFDDMIYQGAVAIPPWGQSFIGGAGTFTAGSPDSSVGNTAFGVMAIASRAVAAGDAMVFTLNPGNAIASAQAAYCPWLETTLALPSIASMFCEFGYSDGSGSWVNNKVAWVFDSTVGTDWRFKTVTNGGVVTTNPTGIVATTNPTRLSVMGVGGLTNGNGWLGMIGGQALAGAGANHMGSTTNLPTGALWPYIMVGSRTAAAAKVLNFDYFRHRAFRGGALIG